MDFAVSPMRDLIRNIARRHGEASAARSGRAVLIGLIGRGIGRSRSPRMHEQEGQRLGLTCSYALIDFDQNNFADAKLGEALAAVEAEGFAGVNVTHPFKQMIVAHLTDLAPDAAAIGAVNTVIFDNGRRIGHNTDCWGFSESFRAGLPDAALEAVILFGAGGGGAAVAHALLELGTAKLDLYDADSDRAVELATRLSARFGRTVVPISDPDAALRRVGGAVNATPVGMDKYPGVPFETGALKASQWVADIVYFPSETELLRRARNIGCRTLAGTGMAVFQAVKAFELFTGVAPDHSAMSRHFEAAA